MINNRPIVVKQWTANFDFDEEDLKNIPIWVKLPNLPLSCWSAKTLSKIGSGLGQPIYADACTSNIDRISYARILVEIDVTKELPKSVKVKDPKGRIMVQELWYDWKPSYCAKCMRIGHNFQQQQQNKGIPDMRNGQQQQRTLQEGKAIVNKQEVGSDKTEASEEQWQQVKSKSAAKGQKALLPEQQLQTVNGFNSLRETSQDHTRKRNEECSTRFNKVFKLKELKEFVKINKVEIIAIYEHRVSESKAEKIITKTLPGWKWCHNVSSTCKGRIWVIWNSNRLQFTMTGSHVQMIHGVVKSSTSKTEFQFSAVYGLHSINDRKALWDTIRSIEKQIKEPWLLMGDFNSILGADGRIQGREVQDNETKDFREVVEDYS
ncbi:PREDICTED: uncharacterized protein LOC109209818 [Nicotiana attenuata]|uniref:uncharacterized protein LOC109209818 n=1 Tax=Nicotiana attenuata TaxID=49451 RepID=UPI000905865C|nr:PREDICTED: uncharacterized protein LOC109209818 [Nicotiana attenuata]